MQAYRNSVPVPRHWSQKRKYLQGKRGIEKPPFVLPDFIEATGIGQMRQAYQVHSMFHSIGGMQDGRGGAGGRGGIGCCATLQLVCLLSMCLLM